MRIRAFGFRTISDFASILGLLTVCLLGASTVSAQPVQTFLNNLSDPLVFDSNLGRSARAVQATCGEIISLGENITGGTQPIHELWRRCNELVATADDRNGGIIGLPRTLGYSDDNELLAAFQQVNGEENQATATMASAASNDQFSGIAARLGALRGATSASISSVTANASDFMIGSGGGAAADDSGLAFSPWGWFLRGTYATGDRDPSNPAEFSGEENGFDFDQYGLTFGIDHSSVNAVWGVAISYSSYELEMDNRSSANIATSTVSGGKIEADSVNGSFYFDYNGDNNVYFSVLSGYGSQSFDMARNFIYFSQNAADPTVNDQTRSLTASPDGDSIGASLALGRVFGSGSVAFDPHIGVTFDRTTIDRFAEVDSGNMGTGPAAMQLAFDEQDIDSLRANLGFQISNNVNTSFGSVRPTFSADWYHEFEDDPRVLRVKYALEDELAGQGNFRSGFGAGNCVSCFDLRSEAPDSDYFVIGAGIAAAYRNGFQAFLMLESLLGYENLDAFSATIGLRGQF